MNHILVVDDEAGIREALVEILSRKKYSATSAKNGQEALDLLNSATILPGLIILDMAMPIMDGKVFLGCLEKDDRIKDIPIFVVSGSVDPITNLPGNCSTFRKPLPVRELLQAVQDVFKNTELL